jgi:hypothetical protein
MPIERWRGYGSGVPKKQYVCTSPKFRRELLAQSSNSTDLLRRYPQCTIGDF